MTAMSKGKIAASRKPQAERLTSSTARNLTTANGGRISCTKIKQTAEECGSERYEAVHSKTNQLIQDR